MLCGVVLDVRLRIHACGIAIALDGTVLLNVAHLHAAQDPAAIVKCAIEEGGDLFIGIALPARDAKEALRWLENGAAEAAGHVGGRLHRRRRARSRMNRSTSS